MSEQTNDDRMFKVGAWVLMEYGFEMQPWYVLESVNDRVRLGNPEWCVSDAAWEPRRRLLEGIPPHKKASFIGFGKKRWWWECLPWRDLVCPFTYPKNTEAAECQR